MWWVCFNSDTDEGQGADVAKGASGGLEAVGDQGGEGGVEYQTSPPSQ